jgi:hypothetical protein
VPDILNRIGKVLSHAIHCGRALVKETPACVYLHRMVETWPRPTSTIVHACLPRYDPRHFYFETRRSFPEYADSSAFTTLTLTGESPGFLINQDEVPKPRGLHRLACHEVLSIRTDAIEKGGHSSSLASLLGAILTFHIILAMETACHPHRVNCLAIRDYAQDLVGRQRGRATGKWADTRHVAK